MIGFFLSFVAGLLTTLSPCVLPLLPMVIGGATRDIRAVASRAVHYSSQAQRDR